MDRFLQEWRDRQRNIVFPDTVRNARPFYNLLWKGSADATPLQRIGVVLVAMPFLVYGAGALRQIAHTRVRTGATGFRIT
jgi:hypothetical protein